MNKLNTTIEQLIEKGSIKTKWSELECHGAVEFINLIFQEQMEYGSIANSIIVENHVVCMSLFDGVPYNGEHEQENIIKVYIDVNDNIIFQSIKGSLYLYETEGVDAEDLRNYYGKD